MLKMLKRFTLAFVLSLLTVCPGSFVASSDAEAFVTVLKDSSVEQVLSVRVLGQSLNEVASTKTKVVVCVSETCNPELSSILSRDGWVVRKIENKDHLYDSQSFEMLLWSLTEYGRLAYIDANAIVLNNIDNVFLCGNFCAVLRSSDMINPGFMVLSPSVEIASFLHREWKQSGPFNEFRNSETFMNSIAMFRPLKYAMMFDPKNTVGSNDFMRLPFEYNLDVLLYYLHSTWSIPPSEHMILHYSLGPVRPSKWWTYPLFNLNWKWNDLRKHTSVTANEPTIISGVCIPAVFIFLLFLTHNVCAPRAHKLKPICSSKHLGSKLGVVGKYFAMAFPISSWLLSCFLAYLLVPSCLMPFSGWLVFMIWTTFFHSTSYYLYHKLRLLFGNQIVEKEKAARLGFSLLLTHIVLYWMAIYILCSIEVFSTRAKAFVCVLIFYVTFVHVAGRLFISKYFQ